MSKKPIEMRVQVLRWDDLIDAVEAALVVKDESDPLWLALDEVMKQVPIAKS